MRVEETEVHGCPVVNLDNGRLSITVTAGKGADMVSLVHIPSGTELLWQSPQGMDVLLQPADGIRYIGGWIEAFPNAWSSCMHQGRELAGYGDVWQLAWNYRILRSDSEAVQVAFFVESRQLPLSLNKIITLRKGASTFRVDETVINTGEEAVAFTWGHHPNLGRPFLSEDCVIELPACEVYEGENRLGEWPFLPGESGSEDLRTIPAYGSSTENRQLLLRNLQDYQASIRNTKTGLSFSLRWDGSTFTDLLLWRSFDTQWSGMFGDNQIVCFFPKRSFHHVADAAAKGESLILEPGGMRQSWIEASVEISL